MGSRCASIIVLARLCQLTVAVTGDTGVAGNLWTAAGGEGCPAAAVTLMSEVPPRSPVIADTAASRLADKNTAGGAGPPAVSVSRRVQLPGPSDSVG